jgi:hypothetical protein
MKWGQDFWKIVASIVLVRKFGSGVVVTSMVLCSHLGGVMGSVFATEPKGSGFKPGQGDRFLMAVNIRCTPYFGWEVKLRPPCRKILRHLISFRIVNKDISKAKFVIFFAKFPHICYWMPLLVGLLESSGGPIRNFLLSISFDHGYISPGR